jgi:ABC-type uncharacterized transport system substrate-binding protein
MFNPDTTPFFDSYYRSFKATSRRSTVEVEVAHVHAAGKIESTIAKLGNEQGTGLILGSDIFIVNMRELIIKLANERGVPTISPYRQFVVEGSLVAYGPDTGDISRRASAYVDRILRVSEEIRVDAYGGYLSCCSWSSQLQVHKSAAGSRRTQPVHSIGCPLLIHSGHPPDDIWPFEVS